jgi:hypothetical protein
MTPPRKRLRRYGSADDQDEFYSDERVRRDGEQRTYDPREYESSGPVPVFIVI